MSHRPTPAAMTVSLLAALTTLPAGAAPHAHQHGVMTLDVAVDGPTLTLSMEIPLDNLLGFERAPRTDNERRAAAGVLARLRAPAGLFTPDAAAQCALDRAEVTAPVLEPGAKPAADGHADLEARYVYTCGQPAQLRALELGLFEAWRRLQRIEVQVAGPGGQSKTTLKRPARSVRLAR